MWYEFNDYFEGVNAYYATHFVIEKSEFERKRSKTEKNQKKI